MPKTYTGKDIAIGFDMKRCIHSRNCFLKLPNVPTAAPGSTPTRHPPKTSPP